jgi:pyrimidine-nucleoside phosphorylase
MSDAVVHPIDAIRHKRDGLALTDAEIQGFVRHVVDRTATDAQIAAWLMAVLLRGLDARELTTLTTAMRFSGETFDPSPLGAFAVDKHSTGGVGDKTSLLIAPIVAAAGLRAVPKVVVPMISGRSLGHTGGTLDKLESIPGFRTQLSLAEFAEVIGKCGFGMIGQTETLVPADRILYALRDHTGTVESPNLICASIMSKKLAAGLNGLVLDVKVGSGAFLKSYDEAEHLARLMVDTGNRAGTRTVALLTSMEEPLGRFSGNWVEVWECVDILKGVRHPMSADLIDLSLTLAGWMLHLGGLGETPEAGRELAETTLASGAAYAAWLQMVRLQGGDVSVFEDPAAHHRPAAEERLYAWRDGFLSAMDCTEVGWALQRLGAGRVRPGHPVSANAGLAMHTRLGDAVREGQPLCTLYADDPALLGPAADTLRRALSFDGEPRRAQPLIRGMLQ